MAGDCILVVWQMCVATQQSVFKGSWIRICQLKSRNICPGSQIWWDFPLDNMDLTHLMAPWLGISSKRLWNTAIASTTSYGLVIGDLGRWCGIWLDSIKRHSIANYQPKPPSTVIVGGLQRTSQKLQFISKEQFEVNRAGPSNRRTFVVT